jgi:2Fe-2S ferredoxin
VNYEGETFHLKTFPNEYRSLMMLIYDKISPEDFGDCLGMGKCSTCLIEVTQNNHLSSYNRNEETTLLKAGNRNGLRLACQVLVDEHIDGIMVNIIRP